MGSVYRALDRNTGAPVALKVLHREGERDLLRFDNEARLLAALSHPGIVRYVAHGVLGADTPYLAMEWLDGEGLDQRLGRAGFTVAESVALVRAVAEALAIAEELLAAQQARPPAYASDLHVLLIYAEARAASGDLSRAAEVLAEARAELLARAEQISDPVIRRSFLEAVPEHARLLARADEWLEHEAERRARRADEERGRS